MARPRYATRRARSRIAQLAAFSGVVFLVVAALAGVGGAAAHALDTGVGQLFAHSSPTASALRVVTRLDGDNAADAAAQDSQVRGLIEAAFGTSPVTVARALSSDTADTAIDGVPAPMLLVADPSLHDRVAVEAGAWPTGPGEVALQATAASALGLDVGDSLTIQGAPATVAALWTARDTSDPAWFGDPAPSAGAEDGIAGPVVVDESLLIGRDDAPRVFWTIVPDPAALVPSRLGGYADGVTLLTASLRDYAAGRTSSVDLQGTLDATVAGASRAAGSASGVLAVPMVLIVVLGGIVLALTARALVAGRRGEFELLRARGSSRPDLVGAAAAEFAVGAVVGGLLGAAAAVGLLIAAGVPWVASLVPTGSALAAGVVGAVVLATLVTVIEVRTPVTGRTDAGRGAVVAALGPFAAALLVAGFAVVQFVSLGAPVRDAGGRISIDPVAVVAPVAMLVALALAAPVIASPILAVAERAARGAPGILPVLPLRQLARRTSSVAAAVLVLAMTAGAVVLAAAYQQGTDEVDTARTTAATGADVRVVFDADASVDDGVAGAASAPLAAVEGASSATAVLADSIAIGGDGIPLLAADPSALAGLPAGEPLGDHAAKLTAQRNSAPLPSGASAITVAATVTPGAGVPADAVVSVVAWLADRDGAALRVPLGEVAAGTTSAVTLSADLPPARSLLALEFTPPALPDKSSISVQLDSVDTGGEVAGLTNQILHLGDHGEPVRALPGEAASAVPVVITDQLAARLDVTAGDKLTLHPSSVSAPITATVAATVPRLPGLPTGLGLFVDLETLVGAAVDLGGSVPSTDEVWLTSKRPDSIVQAIRAQSDQRVEIVTARTVSLQPVVHPTVLLFWVGTAVAALLSALGFAAVMSAVAAERRPEKRPLQSLGMPLHHQRRARLLEGVAVVVVALVLGAAAGVFTASVVIPGLSGSGVGS